jgi:TRAP-type mannitol/chloroaromatic compound transport system permease small subunit
MRSALFAVDRVSALVGKTVGWAVLLLTIIVTYDVVLRKFFSAPTTWAYDVSYMLYGTLFMLSGAYTLARAAHVRGDTIYRTLSPRAQATIDLVLYFLFFLPGIAALVWSGFQFAEFSMRFNERSASSPGGPIIWPYKFVIPVAATLLLVQGVVEIIRCVQCIRDGQWPARLADVEETETRLAREEQF